MEKDGIGMGVLVEMIWRDLRPDFGDTIIEKTSKDYFETVAATYKPIVTVDIYDTRNNLGTVTLKCASTDSILKYCEEFQLWVYKHKTAIEQFVTAYDIKTEFAKIPDMMIRCSS